MFARLFGNVPPLFGKGRRRKYGRSHIKNNSMDTDNMKDEELKAQEAETQKGGTEEGSVKAEEKELTPEEKLEKDLAEAQKTIDDHNYKSLRL